VGSLRIADVDGEFRVEAVFPADDADRQAVGTA
jgi:hypothetical protein